MADISFWLEILKTYGIGALFGFFFMQIFRRVLSHYMKSLDAKDGHILTLIKTHDARMSEKDKQLEKVASSNLAALNANTDAIHKLSESHLQVSHTMRNICEAFDRNSEQNRQEHTVILEACRKAGGK